jgi:selenide,water dikinase
LHPKQLPVIGREVFELIEQGCVPGGTKENLSAAQKMVEWNDTPEALRLILADAQTSGGLLLCVPPRRLEEALALLKKLRTPCAAVIGEIVASKKDRIWLD